LGVPVVPLVKKISASAAARCDPRAVPPAPDEERQDRDPPRARALARCLREALLGEENDRAGLLGEEPQLGRGHAGIERHEDGPQPGTGEQGLEQFGAVGPEVGHPVAGGGPGVPEHPGQCRYPPFQVAIGELTALEADCGARRGAGCRVTDPPRYVHN
jgi:hypothetical protein